MQIKLKPGAVMPAYQTGGSVGMDLHALLDAPIIIRRWERSLVPTGVFLAIPPLVEGHIRPRSGLAFRNGITTLSGTIDFDFRGELKVNLINLGEEDFLISSGDRIAQIVFSPILRFEFPPPVGNLDETDRGSGGFGSTGV